MTAPKGRARGYLERGEITGEQLDAALDVLAMTGAPRAGQHRSSQSDHA